MAWRWGKDPIGLHRSDPFVKVLEGKDGKNGFEERGETHESLH